MENSTSVIGKYWDFLFVELAGVYQKKKNQKIEDQHNKK